MEKKVQIPFFLSSLQPSMVMSFLLRFSLHTYSLDINYLICNKTLTQKVHYRCLDPYPNNFWCFGLFGFFCFRQKRLKNGRGSNQGSRQRQYTKFVKVL